MMTFPLRYPDLARADRLQPPDGDHRRGEADGAGNAVDEQERNASVTVHGLPRRPPPDAQQLADDRVLVEARAVGDADDGGVVVQVHARLDPVPGHALAPPTPAAAASA